MTRPDREEARLLAQAALDGELDARSALEVEHMLAADPALASEHERLAALSARLHTAIPRDRAPDALRARIASMLEPRRNTRAPPRPTWLALAASVVLASGLTGLLTSSFIGTLSARVEDQLVFDHMRALLAPQPVDVASGDRHEVKPWFNAKLGHSPSIVDVTDEGYSFLGGRIDVVAGVAAPTLVYRLRNHPISVTVLPATSGATPKASLRGFQVVRWQEGDLAYWAVSDVSQTDLELFVRAFRERLVGPSGR
jgi:anti-sigma factor RsiW